MSRDRALAGLLMGVDPRLVDALRLIADNPQVLEAALAIAANQATAVAAERVPTIGDLWAQWEPSARARASWEICETHKRTFQGHSPKDGTNRGPTLLTLEDGRTMPLWELPWTQMTPDTADRWRELRRRQPNGRGGYISDQAINRELTTIQSLLAWHVKAKRIPRNPIDGFTRADESQNARKTFLTPEQAKAFIEAGHPLWQDIALVAYRCAGMRLAEVAEMRKGEIDWDAREIQLPARRNKSRKSRVIPFPDDVAEILRRHADASRGEYVFVRPKDPTRTRPVSRGTMQYWLETARERSGLVGVDGERIVFHSLRHAGVTELVEGGAPEAFIKAAAGMTEKTFARYVKFARPQREALRAVMNARKPAKPAPPAQVAPHRLGKPR